MQKSKLLALLGILAVFMTLVACPPADNTSDTTTTIVPAFCKGTWTNASAGDSYVISEEKFKSFSSTDTTATPYYTWDVCGFEKDDNTTDEIYYLYGKVSQLGSSVWGGVEYPASGTIGHYSAACIQKKSDTVILLSAAYYDNSSDNASLDYVKSNFTLAKNAYYALPEYTKQ